MNILSFDLGKTNAYYSSSKKIGAEFECKDLFDFSRVISQLLKKLSPNVVLVPFPVRYYNVFARHYEKIGIIKLHAIDNNIIVIEVNDKRCKKVVLGNGNANKEDVKHHFCEKSEHIADCMLFQKFYELEIKQGNYVEQ